jgi:hypothetical protein
MLIRMVAVGEPKSSLGTHQANLVSIYAGRSAPFRSGVPVVRIRSIPGFDEFFSGSPMPSQRPYRDGNVCRIKHSI